MKEEEILSNLCYYDPRNPDSIKQDIEEREQQAKIKAEKECFCDNCFYRRTELAEEILRLLPLIK